MKISGAKATPFYLIPIASLTACGGGGVNSTPPAPPPPPAAVYSTFTALPSENFRAAGVELNTTEAQQGNQPSAITSLTARQQPYANNLTVTYNAATGSYTIFDPQINTTFAETDRMTQYIDPSAKAYEKGDILPVGDSTRELLMLYRSGEAAAPIPLTYSSLFVYQRSDVSIPNTNNPSGTSQRRIMYGVFGFETLESDMPRSGTATYRAYGRGEVQRLPGVDGAPSTGSVNHFMSGDTPNAMQIVFDANFATGAINTSLTFPNWLVGTIQPVQFVGTGSITSGSNRFAGTFAPNSTGYSGHFDGAFYGPAAAEMGYRFFLGNGAGGMAAGAVVGKKF